MALKRFHKYIKRTAWILALVFPLTLLALLTLAACFKLDEVLIYPRYAARRELRPLPPYPHLEEVSFRTRDHVPLAGWFMEHPAPLARMVYFKGGGGNVSLLGDAFERFYKGVPAHILFFDYRGYGRNPGNPTEQGFYLDGEAAVRYLLDRAKEDDLPLVFWGYSLGGPVSAHASQVFSPDGLILESTLPSVEDLLPSFLKGRRRWFFHGNFNTAGFLENASFPILIMHSRGDRVVPFVAEEILYDKLDGRAEFFELPGTVSHGGMVRVDHPEYWRRIRSFIVSLRSNRSTR
ncbi:MAG: alpha/beta hydrolase [Deltaproteobacteria bacterium]|nr:alpha/beta hydrolase [Deltaproteobacteria bacterium]